MSLSTRILIAGLVALVVLFAGAGVVFLSPYWLPLFLGAGAMIFVFLRPYAGLVLLLLALYFPLLPNVPLGPLAISPTSMLAFGLFLTALNRKCKDTSLCLARWQVILLWLLGIALLFSTLFSDSLRDSLLMLPNLVIYLLLLYIFMALVRTSAQLWEMARLVLILGFVLSIWRVELRPLRLLLGLPSLGINGAAFAFHPAVAVALVLTVMPGLGKIVSRGWRIFAWLTLFSLVFHGFLYETRAAWLVWSVFALLLGLQAPTRARLVLAFVVVAFAGVSFIMFADRIEANLEQTHLTVAAAVGTETGYRNVNSDDLIRLLARDAGLRMFEERPVVGWGPNAYIRLKPSFVAYNGKEARLPGAFNAWLIALVEWGLVGASIAAFIFLLPIGLSWKYIRQGSMLTYRLAFAFALGVLGLSIHLLFIDLLYSFAWAHVGLALASARFALEQTHA